MTYSIVQHPGVSLDLLRIHGWLAGLVGDLSARGHIAAIGRDIRKLALTPHRGTIRDEPTAGLRVIPVGSGATVAFIVHDDIHEVLILSVTWGGADWMQRVRRRT